MAGTFLHGAEVVEITDGARAVTTVKSSVIGIVGTAPDAQGVVQATLALGSVAANTGITLTAVKVGAAGNLASIILRDPRANSQALAVTVDGDAVTVSLATSIAGAITTTATLLLAALAASPTAAAIFTAAATGASTGAGVVSATPVVTSLSGGQDDPFPLNVPTLVLGDDPKIAKLGLTGTLPDQIAMISAQGSAAIVVVRVTKAETEAETLTNVVGGVNAGTGAYTGIMAFLGAESAVGYAPRILCAPGFTGTRTATVRNAAATQLDLVAKRLRAVAIVAGPNTNDADAIAYRGDFGSDRLYVVDPGVLISKGGSTIQIDPAGAVAGLISATDNELGFWNSPSNKELKGIVGTARPIDFVQGDASCRANYLNENCVATIIRQSGFRLWGNRSTAADPKFAFLCVRRTADLINESVLRGHLWAVDRGITRTYFDDVIQSVNGYLADLKSQGAILGGECFASPRNSAGNIQQGQAFFRFRFTPVYPAEHVTFESDLTDGYLSEALGIVE